MSKPIPQPPAIPFIGNALSIDHDVPIRSHRVLAKKYGEIYQINMAGRLLIYLNTYALINEVSDEKRFMKSVSPGLKQMRHLVADGLFTADTDMEGWAIAHRILMPCFGPAVIRDMFPDMVDIGSQMLVKWERMGPDHEFEAADQFTRLTLDTLVLCCMSSRFNSFYSVETPAFVQSMVDFLTEAQARGSRPSVVQSFLRAKNAKFEADRLLMENIARDIMKKRREKPIEKKDTLALMMAGVDPKTGKKMDDDLIIHNLLTFLIAGHETTAAMMTFATYFLIKNPDKLRKMREEIDAVCGDEPITLEHLSRLPYVVAVMRETLRITPSGPMRAIAAYEDTVVGNGKYTIPKDATVIAAILEMHRDPSIWGEDGEEFRPERMLDGKFEALPPNAWQPFGFGVRGCIGRPFAWQEVQLALASIFQKFDLFLADPSYSLNVRQALAIKPKDFRIRAVLREGRTTTNLLSSIPHPFPTEAAPQKAELVEAAEGQPLYVYYGGNTGSCEGFGQRIATDAAEHGFHAKLAALNSATGHLPKDGPVVIITASFEGEPADNAAQFVDWLAHLKGQSLSSVKYIVFGCGNHEWASTYQKIPRLVDAQLEANGAHRLLERGEADAGAATFFSSFDEYEVKLWAVLEENYKTAGKAASAAVADFSIQIVGGGTTRAALLRQHDAGLGEVIDNISLTKPGVPMKRHITFKLPDGMAYRAGDYLAILPTNPVETVRRVLRQFNLSAEHEIVISSASPTTLPIGKAMSAGELFSGFVELSQPATSRDLQALIPFAKSQSTIDSLKGLVAAYEVEVLAKRISVLELLEKYADIEIPLANFIRLLPPMRVRQYSISSSPLLKADIASLTVSVIDAPALSGHGHKFLGVASNYLATLRTGDKVQMVVRSSSAAFHPPSDPLIPMVMFCSGSGLAPFRGFIQDRLAQKESGREVGKMLLFYGCRSPDEDYLYSESDLAIAVKAGIVDVRPAFSRKTEASESCKYVQDRIWHDCKDVEKAYHDGAKFYTCGSRKAANGIKESCVKILKHANPSLSDGDASARFDLLQKERFAADVFD